MTDRRRPRSFDYSTDAEDANPSAVDEAPGLEAVTPEIDDDVSDVGDPAFEVEAPPRSWDQLLADADASYIPRDFSFLDHGPLSLTGIQLPLDRADFCWGRMRKASGDDDPVNVRALEMAGWKPAPADLVFGSTHGAISPLRQRTMDGGVAVEGMLLMYRPKRATADAHRVRDRMAAEPLDLVLSEYHSKVNKAGLMVSELPRQTFDHSREYRGREAVAQLDGDD